MTGRRLGTYFLIKRILLHELLKLLLKDHDTMFILRDTSAFYLFGLGYQDFIDFGTRNCLNEFHEVLSSDFITFLFLELLPLNFEFEELKFQFLKINHKYF